MAALVTLALLAAGGAAAGSPVFSPSAEGLALGVSVDERRNVELLLQNLGDAEIDVWSHVQSGQTVHLDWYELQMKGPTGATRVARFLDDRESGAPVKVHLGPGETVRHTVSLDPWLLEPVNGGRALEPGRYALTAVYEVGIDGAWTGRIAAGPVEVRVANADGVVPEPEVVPQYVVEGDLLGEDP